jgi:hypothetical protein
MDLAILSAASALAGSLAGGASTLGASLLTLRGQLRAHAWAQDAAKREALYAEFIIETSNRLADAWSHQAEGPEVLARLVSLVRRMRLTSSNEVIATAGLVVRQVMDAYAAPNRTFDEARKNLESPDRRDPLRAFSDACRLELRALSG